MIATEMALRTPSRFGVHALGLEHVHSLDYGHGPARPLGLRGVNLRSNAFQSWIEQHVVQGQSSDRRFVSTHSHGARAPTFVLNN